MAAYRFSMVFNVLTGAPTGGSIRRYGGWSESFYWTDASAATITQALGLCVQRAVILPLQCSVSFLRIQRVDPTGPATTRTLNLPGGFGATAFLPDIPQMALLVKARSTTTTNVRNMRICAIPDDQVQYGEYKPVGTFPAAMAQYLTGLSGWKFRAIDNSNPKIALTSIAANGNYATLTPFTPVINTDVDVLSAILPSGELVSGKFTVTAITSATTGTLGNWDKGPAIKGKIMTRAQIYPTMAVEPGDISRIVQRKVGRPSLGFRGRRGRKRR